MATIVLDDIPAAEEAQSDTGSALAVAFFRACLYDLVLCEDELDPSSMRQWETILRGGDVRDYAITRYFRAIAEAKRRVRKPANISAYLVYRLSHGGPMDALDDAWADEISTEGPHCIGCSAPVDQQRRSSMVERIDSGFRLPQIATPFDCDEFVGTHLTQAEVSRLVGREVSFSYQERMIRSIYEELDARDADADSHQLP